MGLCEIAINRIALVPVHAEEISDALGFVWATLFQFPHYLFLIICSRLCDMTRGDQIADLRK